MILNLLVNARSSDPCGLSTGQCRSVSAPPSRISPEAVETVTPIDEAVSHQTELAQPKDGTGIMTVAAPDVAVENRTLTLFAYYYQQASS
jgi:hypothetical protein